MYLVSVYDTVGYSSYHTDCPFTAETPLGTISSATPTPPLHPPTRPSTRPHPRQQLCVSASSQFCHFENTAGGAFIVHWRLAD